MTRYAPLWQQNSTYPASTDRGLISTLWPAATVQGGVVTAVFNTLTVSVASGVAAVPMTSSNGTMLCRWDAPESPPALGPGTAGVTRIDLIVLQVRDATIDAGTNNDFVFQVIPGTPSSGTPVAPSVPPSAIPMAQVLVPNTAANLNGATITDVRPFGPMALGPVQTYPPVAAGSPLVSKTDANGVVWVAKGGVNGGAWRQAKDVVHSRVSRNAIFTIPVAATSFPFTVADTDPYGLYNFGTLQWTAPVSGWYLAVGRFLVGGPAGNYPITMHLYRNGGLHTQFQAVTIAGIVNILQATMTGAFSAGDTASFVISSPSGATSSLYPDQTAMNGSFNYLGSG